MRRVLFAGMLMGLLTCTGCFTTWNSEHDLKTPSSATSSSTSKAPPPVNAEQITPVNGHQICIALEAELMWDEQQRMLSAK